jgi:hypothetical protein
MQKVSVLVSSMAQLKLPQNRTPKTAPKIRSAPRVVLALGRQNHRHVRLIQFGLDALASSSLMICPHGLVIGCAAALTAPREDRSLRR